MSRRHFLLFVLTCVLVGSAGCAPAAPAATPTAIPPTPTPAPQFPIGKFISVHDKARGFQFNADGTFGFYLGGKDPIVEGTYNVQGDQITMANPSNTDPKCTGLPPYKWSFDGQILRFSPTVDDPCRPRSDTYGDIYLKASE